MTIGSLLRQTESALQTLCSESGLKTTSVKGRTGLWTADSERKLASIGFAVRGWVSYHGFSINADLDLTPFSSISPCGFSASVVTSMTRELGRPISPNDLKGSIARHLEEALA